FDPDDVVFSCSHSQGALIVRIEKITQYKRDASLPCCIVEESKRGVYRSPLALWFTAQEFPYDEQGMLPSFTWRNVLFNPITVKDHTNLISIVYCGKTQHCSNLRHDVALPRIH